MWIENILLIVLIPSIRVNINSLGNVPLQSQGQGIQTLDYKRLQMNHLHKNHVNKVWPERCVGFTVNWQDQQQVLLVTLVLWTNQQLPELVFPISSVRNAEPVICLSMNFTYFKWVNTHSCQCSIKNNYEMVQYDTVWHSNFWKHSTV